MATTARQTTARFTCRACHAVFVNESKYLAHKCKQMLREEELKSPVGQTAFHYYQLWFRQQKRMPPPISSFGSSRYFRTFINFTNFTKRVNLPRVETFIALMVIKQYPPTIWMNDEVYTLYLEYLDRKVSGIENATISVQTLMEYADKHNIPLDTVFSHINMQEAIHLVRVRKLSPWLLLFSKTFKHALVNRSTPEQRVILENLIRPDYWPSKMAEHPDEVAQIKRLVAEMGI